MNSLRKTATTFAVALGVWESAGGQPPANDCADPYWQDSLRCVVAGAEVPQPVPAAPTLPGQVKEYTRVDLESDWDVRCLDGTRPVLYVDPAVGGASDRWIFSFTGGGSCAAIDGDDDGTYDDGQTCAGFYFGGEAREMGTADEPAMKHLAGSGNSSAGILSPDPAENPVFAGYHRVRVEKCSYDRYNGRSTHAGLAALLPNDDPFAYTIYHHGRDIIELALDELRGNAGNGLGLSYTTWGVAGDAVAEQPVTLPALENASLVLLVGHSGAAHGLMHNADHIAGYLRSWPQFEGDVRAVFDANFLPAVENEVAFDPGQQGDLYDHIVAGSTPEVGTYDGAAYYTDSGYVDMYDSWLEDPTDSPATLFDASCVAVHEPLSEAWKCRDRYHVLFNHTTVPIFVREDFDDPSPEHTRHGIGHAVQWADWIDAPHCAALGYTPCPPLISVGNPSEHRDRLEAQAATVFADLDSRSELALGEDPSGPPPSIYLWMPDCRQHAGSYSNENFFDVQLQGAATWTMRELLESFVLAPATGAAVAEIDGLAGRVSICSPLVFADGFELGGASEWSFAVP